MRILSYLSEFMIPILIFYIVVMGVCEKRNVYEDFMKGAKDGLQLVVKIMPTMIAMLVAVNVLRASGFLEFIAEILKPLAEKIHFPASLIPLSLIKIFSSSGATGLLLDLYKEYGVDSSVGKIGSLILSSTETIFYTMSLYFVTAGIKKTRYTLAGCLVATVSGIIASVMLAPYM
ncbi:MAG: spore maturation protein [Lachnospiraceae bacterium]|nr:spore maturation protein [Lachnospiraceae bacterium]